MLKRALFAGALGFSMLLLDGGAAMSAEPLAWSWGFAAVRKCEGGVCTESAVPNATDFGYDRNAVAIVDAPGYGSAEATALPSDGLGLPVLRAGSFVEGNASSTAYATAFQGFQNTSGTTLRLSFLGKIDVSRTSEGFGFMTPSLAILDPSVRNTGIGDLWVANNQDGSLTASCDTAAAIAVLNPGRQAGSTTIDTSKGMCDGSTAFEVAPGQEFYILARLLTFQFQPGATNALNTFNVGFSPTMSAEEVALASRSLKPIGLAVPEPSTWAMMIVGFGFVGGALRTRRLRRQPAV